MDSTSRSLFILNSLLDPTRTLAQLDLLPNSIFYWTEFLRLNLLWPWFRFTQTQGLYPPLDSDSTSIRTCFLNLLHEFTRTTYPILTWMLYLSFIRLHQCLSGLICSYPTELLYPILLSIGHLLNRSYSVTLSDFLTRSFPDQTSNYQIVPSHLIWLPYLVGLPSDEHSVKPSSTM
jgi:hypothetical protein